MQIGDVARKVGLATSAIRFYEEAGLLPEADRTASGYRTYDPSVIDRITFIRAGQAVGLTLAELGEVLQIRDRGEPPCRHVGELIARRIGEIDERIRELRRLRMDLVALSTAATDIDPDECTPDSICKILEIGR
ncbi:MAG: MerR family DNA-binding protein [Acidimicrobiia bacterium]